MDENSNNQRRRRDIATSQNDAVFDAMDKRALEHMFSNRGFSPKTVQALINFGMSLPEELLSMTEDELSNIPEITDEGEVEIRRYRSRFARDAAG